MTKRQLDILSILALGIALVAVLYKFSYTFQLAVRAATGQTSHCNVLDAVQVPENAARLDKLTKQYRDASRVIREDGKLRLWSSPKGQFWIPDDGNDELIATLLAEQDMQVYGDARHGVRKGDIVFDAGAHVGVFAREALKAGAKLVIAIEPAPANLECLRRNLAAEIASGRVRLLETGVWEKEDVLEFKIDETNSAGDSFLGSRSKNTQVIKVPVTTIDQIVADLKLSKVDLIKMDIEGSERYALRGAAETLRTLKPRLSICTYHLPTDAEVVPTEIRKLRGDYRMSCSRCIESQNRILPLVLWFN